MLARRAVSTDTSHSLESGSWEPVAVQEWAPLPEGGECLQGQIQMLLWQEGAPCLVEYAADEELKGIPSVTASSD